MTQTTACCQVKKDLKMLQRNTITVRKGVLNPPLLKAAPTFHAVVPPSSENCPTTPFVGKPHSFQENKFKVSPF